MNHEELEIAIEVLEIRLRELRRQLAAFRHEPEPVLIPPDSQIDFYDEKTSEWARL
jgi:hypothetical protein